MTGAVETIDRIIAVLESLLPLIGIALFLFFIANLKKRTIPPDTVHILRGLFDAKEIMRVYRPGDEHHLLLPVDVRRIEEQVDPIGPHLIRWKPSIEHYERFLACGQMPIYALTGLWNTNRNLNFFEYASLYGMEILSIDPPVASQITPPGVPIGTCFCHGEPVTLTDNERKEHVYLVGKTNSGKSTMLLNMAIADIRQGKGVAFLDPHGDTVENLLDLIPRERVKDVIYISGDNPQPLSIMESRNEAEAEILQDDIYTLLRSMSDTWGERMDAILTNTLAALFSAKHCSFLDIYNFLIDVPFRQSVLSRVDNPAIRRFWANYHPPNYPRGSEQPILSRMEKFVTRPTLAAILGSESGIDLYEVMQSGKIFLLNTSRESMGEHTGAVLGGLIVTKFYQTAMRRAAIPENKRRPFYLYIDEFPTYIASPLGSILTQTRKYGLSLTLAHQYLDQASEDTRKAISGQVGTKIVFRLGYGDARHLAHELGPYEPEHIINLSTTQYEALVSPVKGAAHTIKIKTLPPARGNDSFKETILDTQPRHQAPPKPPEPAEDDDDVRPGVLPPC